jgi:hypothetical protein
VLYLRVSIIEASPKAISRRTSYIRVRLEFHRYPHVIPAFFNRHGFGPPRDFTLASTCTWIGHPVSGLQHVTRRPIKTRFRYGSAAEQLNLATYRNSLARSTKSTRSLTLPLLVSTRFQVLFHSPPGVLFTFPSRYYSLSVTRKYLALGGGPPSFPSGFTCLVVLWCHSASSAFRLRGYYPLRHDFPVIFDYAFLT